LLFLFSTSLYAKVEGVVDLHTHLAAHIPYGFMLRGGTPNDSPKPITFEHTFNQHMYKDWLIQSKVKIYVSALLVNVFGATKSMALKQITEQIAFHKEFVKKHSKDFTLATSPAEARKGIEQGKTIIVLALEGGEFLIDSQQDVKFLKDQGIAMVGPIHLIDMDYGDASIMSGVKGVLNWKGFIKERIAKQKRRGLTKRGKRSIELLIKSGIIIDGAHMSERSFNQALELTKKHNLPMVMSHAFIRDIRGEERGLTKKQLKQLYVQGGLLGIVSDKNNLHPHGHEGVKIDSDHCFKSLDDYLLHYKNLQRNYPNEPLGWASDFNGFVSHLRPKFGDKGCVNNPKTSFDSEGIKGPQSLPLVWEEMKKTGVRTNNLETSAERFLQIWEQNLKFQIGTSR